MVSSSATAAVANEAVANKTDLPSTVEVDWEQVYGELVDILGDRHVIRRKEELLTYECDGLTSYRQRPKLVTLPNSTDQVAAVVSLCDRLNIPFVARGAGTGLSGGALPVPDCVLISTARMKRILKVDYDNRQITVEPGVVNNWVTQAVSGKGFYYAPDPSSQIVCSIGGNVAENSGGVHCLKYGVTTNHVLALTVVMPNGEVTEIGGRVPEMPGYDLTGIFVGSEGTLGIATEITLKILRSPDCVKVLLADFTTMEAAGQAVADIIGAGVIPGGMEIMDNLSINAVEDVTGSACYPRDAEAVLLVELDGLEVEVDANIEKVRAICFEDGARDVTLATDPSDRKKLWQGRKAAFAAAGKMSTNYYVQDGVVPRTKLAWVLREIAAIADQYNYQIANVFHAGDGNLHPLVLYDRSVPGVLETVEAIGGEILKRCIQAGGSLSGEHGIGTDKQCYMGQMFSDTDLETMGWVTQAINTKGLANPGKVFPTPKMCGEAANATQANPEAFQGIEQF